MSAFVLDCSVVMAWCFEDEATTASDRLLDRLVKESAIVPALWHLEIANVLAMSERKGRIKPTRISEFIALLGNLPIAVDDETSSRALGTILSLARAHRLTAYDAAYVELAMRLGIPLATKDEDLRKAIKRLGMSLLEA